MGKNKKYEYKESFNDIEFLEFTGHNRNVWSDELLETNMYIAVNREDYEFAAKCRDELKRRNREKKKAIPKSIGKFLSGMITVMVFIVFFCFIAGFYLIFAFNVFVNSQKKYINTYENPEREGSRIYINSIFTVLLFLLINVFFWWIVINFSTKQ